MTTKRKQYWLHHIERCELAAMPASEYCRQEGISAKSFYVQRSKYRRQVSSEQASLSGRDLVDVTELIGNTSAQSVPEVSIDLGGEVRITITRRN